MRVAMSKLDTLDEIFKAASQTRTRLRAKRGLKDDDVEPLRPGMVSLKDGAPPVYTPLPALPPPAPAAASTAAPTLLPSSPAASVNNQYQLQLVLRLRGETPKDLPPRPPKTKGSASGYVPSEHVIKEVS